MRFEELKLVPGARMKLVLRGADLKQQPVAGRYIGCNSPASLLVAVPAKSIGSLLRNGVRVAVSVASPTGIASFSSAVEATASTPYAYVHLLFPREVQWRSVRTTVRVAADLPCQVKNFDSDDPATTIGAHVLDLSTRGLKLGSPRELGKVGDEIGVGLTLALDDIVRPIDLRGKVRSRLVGDAATSSYDHVYGVELLTLPDDDRILLQAYVLDVLQRQGAAL